LNFTGTMPDFLLYLVTALLYAGVAFYQWRQPTQDKMLTAERIALAVGLAFHGWLLVTDIFQRGGINFGLVNALSVILWLTVLIYWVASLRHALHVLQAFVLPPAAVMVLLQKWLQDDHVLPYTSDLIFETHLVIALLAYSLLTFAALHAGLMAMAERSLHHKKSLIRLPDFPPIMVMERLLFQMIGVGFILLTLTVVSGIFFTEQLFHQPLQFNHKTVFSIASWVIFAALLLGRRIRGWRGRVAVRWTLGGFVLLLLAYVGSKFVLEVILGR
jgi:ABC-type uncharacterized transport system permease subunit